LFNDDYSKLYKKWLFEWNPHFFRRWIWWH
jgi:hypothetical protein